MDLFTMATMCPVGFLKEASTAAFVPLVHGACPSCICWHVAGDRSTVIVIHVVIMIVRVTVTVSRRWDDGHLDHLCLRLHQGHREPK